jgi:hypothetical protein
MQQRRPSWHRFSNISPHSDELSGHPFDKSRSFHNYDKQGQDKGNLKREFQSLFQNTLNSNRETFRGDDDDDYNNNNNMKPWKDPFQGYTIQQLEEYVATRQTKADGGSILKGSLTLEGNDDDNNVEEEEDDDDDSLYLDAEFYVESQEYIAEDGSILLSDDKSLDILLKDRNRQKIMQNYLEALTSTPNTMLEEADSPSSLHENIPENPTEEDLWKHIRERGTQPSSTINGGYTAEELHRKVFENEQGYLQSSAIFQKALIDPEMAQAAAAERRGKRFRQRQQHIIQKLEQDIQDFEAQLLNVTQQQQEDSTNNMQMEVSAARDVVVCAKCKCPLSDYERSVAAQRNHLPNEALCVLCRMDLLLAKTKQDQIRPQNYQPTIRQNFLPGTKRSFSRSSQPPIPSSSSTLYKNGRVPIPYKPRDRSAWYRDRRDLSFIPSSATTRIGNPPPPPPQQQNPLNGNERTTEPPRNKPASSESNDSSTVSSPWVKVTDPDTKEVFYWNEKTEEMRWELES